MSVNRSQLGLAFESLGGGSLHANGWGFGCEFGLFQRDYCGIEPLGLLRWASINPDALIKGLQTDFSGVFEAENFQLHTVPDHPHWHLHIVHNDISIKVDHTYLDKDKVTIDEAKSILTRSYQFLLKKFLDDLVAGDKILVYRVFDHVLPIKTLKILTALLQRHGVNKFLYVQTANSIEERFVIESHDPNLFVGKIDFFAPQPGCLKYNNSGWEKICREALKAAFPDG